jgi:pyruvate ferredoxin oxidoreductase beta subunit/2-oxoisovalerate ferredoxin oxidoreductase beta subunit
VPTAATTFASSPAVATGVEAVAELNGEDIPVVCWAGDGGTYDIGIATLSAAAERNENLIYICYDNEIYGNTGGQRSSATPEGVATTTTPKGKIERKKDIMAIMAGHRIPYAATLSVAHRDDFLRKIKTARKIRGFKFLVMLSPCPTGWKSDPGLGTELVRMAVRCGLFPLYEVFDGMRYRISVRPDGTPLEQYLGGQKRYKSESIDVGAIHSPSFISSHGSMPGVVYRRSKGLIRSMVRTISTSLQNTICLPTRKFASGDSFRSPYASNNTAWLPAKSGVTRNPT